MTVFYNKKHWLAKKMQQQENLNTTDFCPKCFSNGNEVNRSARIVSYQCEKCKHKWDVNSAYKDKAIKEKNINGIVIRDRSKEKSQEIQPNSQSFEILKAIINDCILSKKLVEFTYDTKDRIIQPYVIETRGNSEVLFGFCLEAEGPRMFKLEKIQNMKKSDK